VVFDIKVFDRELRQSAVLDAAGLSGMKSAGLVFSRLRRPVAFALFLVSMGAGGVSAQSPSAAPALSVGPPVTVSGWRYQRSGSDAHIFRCEQSSCGLGSKVSYRLYAPGSAMTMDQFRGEQEKIVKALEQRTPGEQITIVGVDGDKGSAVPRMFQARRLKVTADGAREYQVSGMLFGQRANASLISSSPTEKSGNANYAQFAAGVMLMLTPKTR
jgi:hypothetical protein